MDSMGKCPTIARGGGGWAQLELTDALCIYAIAVYYTMNSLENERVPSLDELCSKIPILSEYCAKLDDSVKRRYVEKIAEIGVDKISRHANVTHFLLTKLLAN